MVIAPIFKTSVKPARRLLRRYLYDVHYPSHIQRIYIIIINTKGQKLSFFIRTLYYMYSVSIVFTSVLSGLLCTMYIIQIIDFMIAKNIHHKRIVCTLIHINIYPNDEIIKVSVLYSVTN